jgi:hypothetical protein
VVPLGRDDDLGAGFGDLLAQTIGVIAFITDRGSRIETVDKLMCEGDVGALPRTPPTSAPTISERPRI